MKVNVFHTSYGVVYSAEIPSRSRSGLKHYTRAVVYNGGYVSFTCDCEAFAMKRECWHIKLLKNMLSMKV